MVSLAKCGQGDRLMEAQGFAYKTRGRLSPLAAAATESTRSYHIHIRIVRRESNAEDPTNTMNCQASRARQRQGW